MSTVFDTTKDSMTNLMISMKAWFEDDFVAELITLKKGNTIFHISSWDIKRPELFNKPRKVFVRSRVAGKYYKAKMRKQPFPDKNKRQTNVLYIPQMKTINSTPQILCSDLNIGYKNRVRDNVRELNLVINEKGCCSLIAIPFTNVHCTRCGRHRNHLSDAGVCIGCDMSPTQWRTFSSLPSCCLFCREASQEMYQEISVRHAWGICNECASCPCVQDPNVHCTRCGRPRNHLPDAGVCIGCDMSPTRIRTFFTLPACCLYCREVCQEMYREISVRHAWGICDKCASLPDPGPRL